MPHAIGRSEHDAFWPGDDPIHGASIPEATGHTRRIAAPYARYPPVRQRLQSPPSRGDVQMRAQKDGIAPERAQGTQILRRCPPSPTRMVSWARRRAWRQESDSVAERHRNPRAYRRQRQIQPRAKGCEATAAPVLSRARASCSPSSSSSRRLDWRCGKR